MMNTQPHPPAGQPGSIFEALQAAAQAHGDRPALVHVDTGEPHETPRTLSYRQLLAGVTRMANGLRSLGANRQGCVGLLLPNLVEHHLALWGAETASIAFPLNPLLKADHLVALLRAARATVLLVPGPVPGLDLWDKAVQIRAALPSLEWIVQVGGEPVPLPGVRALSQVLAEAPDQALGFDHGAQASTIAAYFHTGGTTGAPKIVRHTHGNQLSAAAGFGAMAALQPGDVVSNGFPLFHVAGSMVCTLAPYLAGATVLNLSAAGFRNPRMVSHYWRLVERHRITIAGGVPTALGAVAAVPVGDADLSSIRSGYTGGALVPRSVALAFEKATGKPVREVYGMTEAAGVIAVDPMDDTRVLGSAGRAPAGTVCEVRRLQADGRLGEVCGPGQPGVLTVRGPSVTPGYLDPSHDRDAFTQDGALVTGDLACMDPSGRITITGRSKDLIIRSGHNIDPAMIEEALGAHPDVAAVAAVGQPDAYAGEVPVAYVVMKAGAAFDDDALTAFAQDRIGERPAWPRHLLQVDALPLTAVGKVYKPALRLDATRRLVEGLLTELPVERVDVTHDAGSRPQVVVRLLQAAAEGRAAAAADVLARLQGFLFDVVVHHDAAAIAHRQDAPLGTA